MSVIFDLPTVIFLFYVLLLSPFLAVRGFLKIKSGQPLPPKLKRFRSGVFYLLIVTLFALTAAEANHIHIPLQASVIDLIFIAGVAGFWSYFGSRVIRKRSSSQLERSRLLYAPTNPQELRWALAGAVCAGVCEEIIYRCVLFELIYRFSSSLIVALIVCIVTFAQAHMSQGKKGVVAVGYMGLMFHVLFLTTHTLAVPIGVHAIYDAIMFSTWYMKERRLGLEVAETQTLGQSA
jgi:membrane protease YdiL (CAAX protease family)